MNRLAAILPVEQVLVGVDATSKKRAFEEAGLLFESLHGLSRALVTDSLFARERLGSTGLGHGVAIPHAKTSVVDTIVGCVGISREGIDFDATFALELGELRIPVEDGLVELSAEQIKLTPVGQVLMRNVAVPFDRYLRERKARGETGKSTFSKTL